MTLRLALIAFALAMPALAQADLAGTMVTLSPERAEAAKEAGAASHALDSATLDETAPRDDAIHGEVGVSIGTGGYSEVFGTAVAPLGDRGSLALSVENVQFGRRYRTRH